MSVLIPIGSSSLDKDSAASEWNVSFYMSIRKPSQQRTVNRSLRGTVGPDSWETVPSNHRTNEYHYASLVTPQMRQESPGGVQSSEDIGVELSEPLVVADT